MARQRTAKTAEAAASPKKRSAKKSSARTDSGSSPVKKRGRPRKSPAEDSATPALSPTKRTAQRQSANKSPVKESTKSRSPSHCHQGCHGRPLRSQCMHTKSGRDYLLKLQASASVSVNPFLDSLLQVQPPNVLPNTHAAQTPTSWRLPSHSLPSPQSSPIVNTLTPTRANIPAPAPVDSHPFPLPQSSPPVNPLSQVTAPVHPAHGSQSGPHQPETEIASPIVAGHPISDADIDPLLLQMDDAEVSLPTKELSSHTPSSRGETPSRHRIRPNRSNPIHGTVQGVKRGNSSFNVVRQQRAPESIVSTAKASKTFLRRLHTLVEGAEQLSLLTGSWVFLGAQHPNATGPPIHFMSSRLVRDSRKFGAEFANHFHELIHDAAQNKRKDTVELQHEKKLQAKKIKTLESENAHTKAMLEHYVQRFGAISGNLPGATQAPMDGEGDKAGESESEDDDESEADTGSESGGTA